MIAIEECVTIAMDCSDKDLFPFLPYILQDVWEIGSDPNSIIKLIKKHCSNLQELKVLDLGCGKGAVSVKIAKECACFCYGIDAIPEFIDYAKQKANELQVSHLCIFEIGDIREKIIELSDYDIVILGAIGPVFGDYYSTLTSLSKCLNKNGIFIIDDGYIDDESDFIHPLMLKKSDILHQIEMAGMQLIENDIMDKEYIKDSDDYIFENIKRRCYELIEQYPNKQSLFLNYIHKQELENDILENKVIGTTMVIKKNLQ